MSNKTLGSKSGGRGMVSVCEEQERASAKYNIFLFY